MRCSSTTVAAQHAGGAIVTLSTETTPWGPSVVVDDDGPAYSRLLEHRALFERFYRASRAAARGQAPRARIERELASDGTGDCWRRARRGARASHSRLPPRWPARTYMRTRDHPCPSRGRRHRAVAGIAGGALALARGATAEGAPSRERRSTGARPGTAAFDRFSSTPERATGVSRSSPASVD